MSAASAVVIICTAGVVLYPPRSLAATSFSLYTTTRRTDIVRTPAGPQTPTVDQPHIHSTPSVSDLLRTTSFSSVPVPAYYPFSLSLLPSPPFLSSPFSTHFSSLPKPQLGYGASYRIAGIRAQLASAAYVQGA